MTRSKAKVENRKHGFQLPKTVRTLGLPSDFQLYIGGRPVRAARASQPFVVRSRSNPDFKLRVPRVRHTLGALVRWILWRYKKAFGKWAPLTGTAFRKARPIRLTPLSPPLFVSPLALICLSWGVYLVLRRCYSGIRGRLLHRDPWMCPWPFTSRVVLPTVPYRPFTRAERQLRQEEQDFNGMLQYIGWSDEEWNSL